MLLLDGQNRLASLAWMTVQDWSSLPSDVREEEFETWMGDEVMVLDYATRSLRFVPRAEADVGMRLPAWTVVGAATSELTRQTQRLMREKIPVWDAAYGENALDDFYKLLDNVTNQFRNARVSETVIEDATEDEAAHAFTRICRVGVPMSEEDFRASMRLMRKQN